MEFDLSPSGLLAGMLFSTIGFGLFLYGKNTVRIPQLVTGILLMVYPLFITGAGAVLSVGTVLLGGMWLAVRAGS